MVRIPKSPYSLGIDLGTTNSSAAFFKGNKIYNVFTTQKSIPSVVRFTDRKIDQLVVGNEAKRASLIYPEQVITSVKTLMKNDDWKNDENLKEKFNIDGEELTPTDVAAEILKKILEQANQFDPNISKGAFHSATICVPANTTNEYRRNVYKAAEKAGFGLRNENNEIIIGRIENGKIIEDKENGIPIGVYLLEEPTAAAIAYGLNEDFYTNEKEQTILVYDMGGGTFDVTVLHVDSQSDSKNPIYTVKSTKGISNLGGDEFDKVIMELCGEKFKEDTGIDVFDIKSDFKALSAKDKYKAQSALKEKAEEAKIELANNLPECKIDIPGLITAEGEIFRLEYTLTKDDFVQRIQPRLIESIECATDALKDANLTIEDVNRIVLVGGSTKAPWIKELIVEKLGKEPYMAEDVDLIVSEGAAIYASDLPIPVAEKKCPRCDKEVAKIPTKDEPCPFCGYKGAGSQEDTLPKHIGIQTKGGLFSLILKKDLKFPEEQDFIIVEKQFGVPHMQTSVNIVVWETQATLDIKEENGNYEMNTPRKVNERNENNEKVFEYLGEFTVKGIPAAPEGTIPVDISMMIGKDKILRVKATVIGPDGTPIMEEEDIKPE